MTEFIIAKACADATERLYKKLLDEVSHGGRVTLIVPDQYEFETERALYRRCAAAGSAAMFSSIAVKTFSGISTEIITKYAGSKKPADDITKHILMYRAVSELGGELEAFGKIALKPGFAPKINATIAALKGAGISAERFCDTIGAASEDFRDSSPLLFSKLSDVSRIYSVYDALLSQSYSDRLDSTAVAAVLAAQHGLFKGESVYCDSFSDFSKSQLQLLFSIIDLAENVTFSFVSDCEENCREIFSTVNACISALAEHSRAADKQVEGASRVFCDNERFSSPALAAVAEGVFGDMHADCPSDGVRIIKCGDVYGEADFAAAEIRRLITEEGYRCREIAVLSANAAEYKAPIESSFDKYGVPLFYDAPESILHLPLVNLVLSLVAALKSFNTENILSYIKSGFIQKSDGKPLTMRDINDFEDYIYEWQLKGEALKQPFPEINGRIPRAEKIRADIIPPLIQLKESLNGCTGDEITKQICDFLFDTVGIQRAVAAHCKTSGSELLSDSDKHLAESYQTLWNTMLEIFEGLYKGLYGFKISLADYYSLLRDICTAATLAKPPQTVDSVLAGDISRTRASGVRAVFIIGAAYGSFPADSLKSGIFTEYESELLGESIVKLGMNRKERCCYERYLACRALSLPTERLYLTYPVLGSACDKKSPSDVIPLICGIFGKDLTENAADMGDEFYCRSLRAAQQRFAGVCSEDSERRATLKSALKKSGAGAFTQQLESLTKRRRTAYLHRLDGETAQALFRSRTFSATKLERLNQCRFRYFCDHGLRIRERTRRNLSSMEIGNVVHYVLQKVLEKYCADMPAFVQLSREQLAAEVRAFLDEYKALALGGDYAKTLRFGYLYKNLTIGAVDMLVLLQAEFNARDYRPKFFELRLGGSETTASSPAADSARTSLNTPALAIEVRDDISVSITGIIDRADTFTDESGNEYIRVVDYKTGVKEFSMVNVYYGINTQMLLYLIAVCEANPELHAGGVSYLPSQVTEPVDKKTAPFALLAQNHTQSGMYIRTDSSEREMNKYAQNFADLSGVKSDKFIPSAENILTEDEFNRLAGDCKKQTAEALGRLYGGDMDAVPTVYKEKSKEKKACIYCRFKSICGHNKDNEIHALPQETDEGEEN